MSRAIAAAKPSIESVVAADRQPTRQSRKQRHQETDRPSTSIKALAKTTASVNHRIARPPRLILIDAPFSPRLSRYTKLSSVMKNLLIPFAQLARTSCSTSSAERKRDLRPCTLMIVQNEHWYGQPRPASKLALRPRVRATYRLGRNGT